MSRKRNKRKSPSSGAGSLTTDALIEKAKQSLDNGKFKDAIGHFKVLIKKQPQAGWLEWLAEAYSGRTVTLAEKGMLKEAILIWRNRAELCDKHLAEPLFLRLLAIAGQTDELITLLNKHQTALAEQQQLVPLHELLAALVIAGNNDLLTQLPANHPVVTDYPSAFAALQAYCQGDDEALQAELKTIPFRSPYKDLRQILKALVCKVDETRVTLLQRISPDSPFNSLAQALANSQLADEELYVKLNEQEPHSQALTLTLKGWIPLQKFINELINLGKAPSEEALMRLLTRHQAKFEPHYLRQLITRLLIPSTRCQALIKLAANKPTPFEIAVIQSIQSEIQELNPRAVLDAWGIAINIQQENLRAQDDVKTALIIALMLNHRCEYFRSAAAPAEILISEMSEIIKYDPEDKETYLQLLPALRSEGMLKEARQTVEKATKYFPDDMEILTEAVETALASNAFKKAAKIARKILDRDPINHRVRQALINAHLAHTRKLIKQSKFSLAEKELQEASSWAKSPADQGKIDLVSGVLQVKQKHYTTAQQLFDSATTKLGGALCGRFLLLLELNKQACSVSQVLKQCHLEKTFKNIELTDLMALFKTLNRLLENEDIIKIKGSFDLLKVALKKGVKLHFSFSECLDICDTLKSLDHHELRQHYAKAALKHWRNAPVFVYHALEAKVLSSDYLSTAEFERVKKALSSAQEAGDTRVSYNLQEIIDRELYGNHFFDEYDDDDDEIFSPFGSMEEPEMPTIEMIVDFLLDKMPKKEINELRRSLGEKGLQDYVRDIAQSVFDDTALPPIPSNSENEKKKTAKKTPNETTNQGELF